MSESTSEPPDNQDRPLERDADAFRDSLLEEQLNSTDKITPTSKDKLASQERKRIKLSARDILDSLSEKRIEITEIEFGYSGLQESGGKSDVILAKLVVTVGGWTALRNVAVKKLRPSTDVDDERFLRAFVNELRVLAGLSHLNIVETLGFVEDLENGVAWMVFPWEANGNVREFLRSDKWEIPERVSLIKDVASGLEYLHTRQPPICHGDLKSLNVLVNSSFRAVITDFGSARVMRHLSRDTDPSNRVMQVESQVHVDSNTSPQINLVASNSQLTLTGPSWSFRWAAPEVLNGEEPGLASDIWAFGWICWEIVTDSYPFSDISSPTLITLRVVEGQLPSLYNEGQLSQIRQLCNIMLLCWQSRPNERPSASGCSVSLYWIPSTIPSMKGSNESKIRSAELLSSIAETLFLQNLDNEVVPILEDSLALARSTNDQKRVATALYWLGTIYREWSKYSESEEYLNQALSIYTGIGDSSGEAETLKELGRFHLGKAQHAKAEEYFKRAQALYVRLGNEAGQANALENLGSIYWDLDQNTEAEKAFTQSLEIQTRIGNELGRAAALRGLAEVRIRGLMYAEAEDYLNQSLAIFTWAGNEKGRAQSLLLLSDTQQGQFKVDAAEESLRQALAIYRRIGSERGQADCLLSLGQIYQEHSKIDMAAENFVQALTIYERNQKSRGTANASLDLGKIRLLQARYSEARTLIANAAEISERVNYQYGKRVSQELHAEAAEKENESSR